jgi:hypothetical protein
MPRITPPVKTPADGEIDVWVTYDTAPDGQYYPPLQNGFRSSFWGKKGYATAIMFVDIPANALLPGQTTRVKVYTISVAYMIQCLTTEKIHWGPLKHPAGTLSLFPPES